MFSLLPRTFRLRRNQDFQKVYQRGQSIGGRYVVLYRLHHQGTAISSKVKDKIGFSPALGQRFGFSVSSKVGNAVTRNYIKRVFRAICRRHAPHIAKNHDIILIARHKIKGIHFEQVEQDIVRLLKRGKLWVED
ncbi:ribonuclease P protein component [Heliophilum fasciatum]|uniref:ribonuclease P protein component n=1 Tax=Heliophilum fasciatum TaxID=35700 RepID=UPI00140454BD|nr:ribonuclease P protein component [Heliophilum fasciatum]MCW2278281.1 ribonuclease P protein component [Heliophilum fasciatum]